MSVRVADRYLVSILSVIAFTATIVGVKGFSLARDFYRQSLEAQHPQAEELLGNVDGTVVFLGDSRISQWSQRDAFAARYIGYPGASSHQIASQFDTGLLDKSTSVVIVEAGVNDLRLAGLAPERVHALVDESFRSLQGLTMELATKVDQVILLTVFPTADAGLVRSLVWGDEVQQSVDRLNDSLRAASWPSNVRVLDCDAALLPLGDLAFVDTLHLTESGYDALNALLEPILITAVSKVREI